MKAFSKIFLVFGLLFSAVPTMAAASAEDADPAAPLSPAQVERTRSFATTYVDFLNAVAVLTKSETSLRSDVAARIYQSLVGCEVKTDDNGALVVRSEGCPIDYSATVTKTDKGLNENGDPVTEVDGVIHVAVKNSALATKLGFVSFSILRKDHNTTLASTPSFLTTTDLHVHFLTSSGEEVALTSRSRLYTNMETEERTFFRVLILELPDAVSRFEIVVRVDSEGLIKGSRSQLNKVETSLEVLESYYTAELLGISELY